VGVHALGVSVGRRVGLGVNPGGVAAADGTGMEVLSMAVSGAGDALGPVWAMTGAAERASVAAAEAAGSGLELGRVNTSSTATTMTRPITARIRRPAVELFAGFSR